MTVKHAIATDLGAVAGKVTKLGYKTIVLPPKAAKSQSAVATDDRPYEHDHAGHPC